jgi:hypothetical protein
MARFSRVAVPPAPFPPPRPVVELIASPLAPVASFPPAPALELVLVPLAISPPVPSLEVALEASLSFSPLALKPSSRVTALPPQPASRRSKALASTTVDPPPFRLRHLSSRIDASLSHPTLFVRVNSTRRARAVGAGLVDDGYVVTLGARDARAR